MSINVLNIISLITGICAAAFALVAVILFFHDHISDLMLTGTSYLTKRTEKRLRNAEAQGGT